MKITMYELLGMVKDGKAPKKVKYHNEILYFDDETKNYYNDEGMHTLFSGVSYMLNDEIEILEEKKIPEKLDLYEETQNIIRENNYKLVYHDIHKCIVSLECKYNQLIDYLKSKGE